MTIRRNRIVEGSCWACRKRRIKCDLLKPSCTRCQATDETCGYGPAAPVKWVGGIALRGRNAPANLLRRSSSNASSCTDESSPSPDYILHTALSPKPLQQDGLMLYFAHAVLPRFTLGDPLFEADLTGILQDDALRHTVIAVSQAHHSFDSKAISHDAVQAGKQTRHVAIQRLRKCLADVDSDKAASDVFTTVVLLCMLDGMIEPCEDANASIYHLKGGCAMLGRWTNIAPSMLMTTGLQAHLLSLFATMDLVQAVISGSKPHFEPESWSMFAYKTAWFGRLRHGDKFLEILKTLSEMASLGHVVHTSQAVSGDDDDDDDDDFPASYRPSLWGPDSPEALTVASPDPSLTADEAHWETFCSVFEIALLIYHSRALRQLPVDDPDVQYAARTGVSKLMDGSLPGMLAHCTILPLLIIGAHCTRAQERRAICKALSPSASFLSFGSLKLMSKFLSETWENDDMQISWWTMFQPVAGKAFLF